jgi:hypothetical protein
MARQPITRANPYTPKSGAFAGRTFTTEREYRNALARRKNFDSWSAQQRARKRRRKTMRAVEVETRLRALDAVAAMRPQRGPGGVLKPGLSLTRAAIEAGTTPNAVLRYAGAAITRDARGRYVAKRRDTLYRRMRVLSTEGEVFVDVPSSTQATLNARHANAVKKYRDTGDPTDLAQFRGKKVGGYELETDLAVLTARARADELDVLELYDHTR